MSFETFRSSDLKNVSSATMYILCPEIDITFLRDAVSESRTGILKLWDRRSFAYRYHKFSRDLQVLHIVSTNSGTWDQDPRRTIHVYFWPGKSTQKYVKQEWYWGIQDQAAGIEKIR